IFSATTRSAGSSDASGSGATVSSVTAAGAAGAAGSVLILAVGGSPAGIASGRDASLVGDATAGDLAASCAETPNGAASSKARAVPANMRSQRGPLISDSPNLAPLSEKKPAM